MMSGKMPISIYMKRNVDNKGYMVNGTKNKRLNQKHQRNLFLQLVGFSVLNHFSLQ
jgi:hypothetical protein